MFEFVSQDSFLVGAYKMGLLRQVCLKQSLAL